MPTRLRRTIYIGIGGTGLETISMVKKYYKEMSPSGILPPMIKFLAIDTDPESQLMQGFTVEERVSIAEKDAKPFYNANKERYKTLPNKESIRSLSSGAGQIRSLGKYAVAIKEQQGQGMAFTDKFSRCYDQVQNINNNDSNYEVLGTDVEIHIVFSLSGGTGSGSFLSLAYLIRQINPNLKIVGYAFSHSFFVNLPTSERIKQNAYASLLELDYCMHAENEAYQDIAYPTKQRIEQAPFDIFMYIDNKTYTTGGQERSYIYQPSDKLQVETRVAYAMVISAGDMGAAGVSVWDNLISDIKNHTYDVTLNDTKHTKKGWVSSLGIGEIICAKDSEKGLFTDKLVVKILKTILSSPSDSAATIEAYNWVKEFDLNESSNEEDQNAVINKLISPDRFSNLTVPEINQDAIVTGKNAFFQRVRISEEEISRHRNNLETVKKREIKDKIIQSIFPNSDNSAGIERVLDVLDKFNDLMKQYAVIMTNEKKVYVSKKTMAKQEWENTAASLNDLLAHHTFVLHFEAHVQGLEEALVSSAIDEFVADCEIRRRDSAQQFFLNISSFVEGKISSLKNLKSRIKSAIETVENKINSTTSLPTLSAKTWGTIDLTKEVVNLETTSVDSVQFNLSDFFTQTQYTTIEELADSTNIEGQTVSFAKSLYNKSSVNKGNQYPIIRILKNLNDEDLKKYMEYAVSKYSTPLMEIDKYGESVRDTQHVYVAIPEGRNGDSKIKQSIIDALSNRGNQINWVDINDPNRILIYRQIGVVPPFFISGVSSGRNGSYKAGSCQEKFEKELGPKKYSPFTDLVFEEKYTNEGFRLDSEKRENASLNITLWVQGIILGLIVKSDNSYKLLSEYGDTDVEDELCRSWFNLGTNRVEAFETFSRNNDLEEELKINIENLLNQKSNKERLESFYGTLNAARYRQVSLIDFGSEEWEDAEVKKLFKNEIDFLKRK